MNSLYVVGVPAGDPRDLGRRAVRILREVTLVVAAEEDGRQFFGQAQRTLASHGITTPLATATREAVLAALEKGAVACLCPGWRLGLSESACQLVRAAFERGHPVVPIPGPALPITALVISGLPADSFVYVGELPRHAPARHDLLASIAGERRTLVLVERPAGVGPALTDLQAALDDRPAVIVAAREESGSASEIEPAAGWGAGVVWRGSLAQAAGWSPELRAGPGPIILVVGGAREQQPGGARARWDEARLRAEIETCLEQGLGAREIGRRLAAESGWPRREIYHLVAQEEISCR